ncbi:hypothetical protein ONS95_008163 [Cadophora gregata]|uniref:uncharacterized protein n=1 Tax=Cadophora gregata TaxID=51156 RepID=UPI0026DC04AD|nr:uncharacterized protein ONS95_008163 [Cadophora gregata]KAK0119320.1 hypothetical protein ONS96_012374 [Cadophora gregata f. sp. sojae]KAK0126574.1 hypothetical protein ONS95_008163 [Cadophora gregata]
MPRTSNTHPHTFSRSGPSSVTYEVPSPPYSSPHTTITIPIGSTWTSGLHWHETHTEYLQVLSGAALITLNEVTRIYTSQDGVVTVPRYARHEWQRASRAEALGVDFGLSSIAVSGSEVQTQNPRLESLAEQDLVVREWTSPTDSQKEIFFRNLSGIISYAIEQNQADWYLILQLWVLFLELDNYPVFFQSASVPVLGGWLERLSLGRVLEWAVCHFLLWCAVVVGKLLGVKGMRKEYTPVMVNRNAEEIKTE